MDQAFERCKGAIPIADDIKVYGTENTHDMHLHEAMERARSAGIKLNYDKCLSMDTSHSVFINVDRLIFSITELNFEIADKLSPVSNMASSRSEENVNLRHFPTQDGFTVLVSPAILLDSCDFLLLWQIFLPLLYGTVMLFGRCYCLVAI